MKSGVGINIKIVKPRTVEIWKGYSIMTNINKLKRQQVPGGQVLLGLDTKCCLLTFLDF